MSITGTDIWLSRLNKAIASLAQPEFEDSLFALVNEAVLVDHCAVFISHNDGSMAHLFTRSKLDETTCQNLARAYTENFHSQDPNLSPAMEEGERLTLLPHRSPTSYSEDYKARFFTHTGLIDKLSSLLQASGYSIYCSFYRLEASGKFRQTELAELSRILPILTNLIFKHARLSTLKQQENQPDTLVTQVPLSRTMDVRNAVFAKLTERESQVCLRILQGYSSEAISLDLGVAISTIHTYRKRAYGKLGISAQNELFSLYLEFVPLYEDRQENS